MPPEMKMKHHDPVGPAMARAAATGKKIVVLYGGDWCSGSRRMEAVLRTRDIARLLNQHFVLVKRYVGPDGSSIPCLIERPPMRSVPFFSLVTSEGKILRNQATEPFEFLWFYRRSAIYRLFEEWAKI